MRGVARGIGTLAMTAVAAAGIPGPTAAWAQTLEVCADSPIPYDYVVTDHKWSATRCARTPATQPNMLVIERYADKPEGSQMTVCASAPVPPGWALESTSFNAVRCKLDSTPGRLDHNVKVIRRLGGGDVGAPAAHLTGVFTDLRRSAETGDVIGTEVFLLAAADGGRTIYYALVQFAEGVPEPPQLVEVEAYGDRIAFVAYLFGRRLSFRGRVTADALEGQFEGLDAPVRLPRGRSFWQ